MRVSAAARCRIRCAPDRSRQGRVDCFQHAMHYSTGPDTSVVCVNQVSVKQVPSRYACPCVAPPPAACRALRPSTCTSRASTPPSMGSSAACIWLLLCAARVSSMHSAL